MVARDPYRQTGGQPRPAATHGEDRRAGAGEVGRQEPSVPPQGTAAAGAQGPPPTAPMQPAGVCSPPVRSAPQAGPPAGAQQGQGARSGGATPESTATIRVLDEDESRQQLSAVAIKSTPPWLVSAAFHMALLIILGLLVVAASDRNRIRLDVETAYAEQLGQQLEFDSPLGRDEVDAAEKPVLTPDVLPEVEDPFAAPAMLEILPDGTVLTSDLQTPQIGLALLGREEGSKEALLGRYGGSATTEAAVLAGLHWLARNQQGDGSWRLTGPYSNGVHANFDNPAAATAMALLAFQGSGVTPKAGKPASFRGNVSAGWKWLLGRQDSQGNFFQEGPILHRFYTQGQCTIAICELYGMTKDPAYKEPAERAVGYCLRSQSSLGGWRYSPNSDSDVSVTGWIVMALQSARMAGLKVPGENLRRVEQYLDSVGRDGGSRYPYQPDGELTCAMTAEALLCRQYLGWARDDPRLVRGVKWITSPENLVNYHRRRNVYYWYYATQVAHHMGGEYWERWNGVMRQVVPEQQVKQGPEEGSWDPELPTSDRWGGDGGRLYVTCLSIYMLEVYYRHLPLYAGVYSDQRRSDKSDQR